MSNIHKRLQYTNSQKPTIPINFRSLPPEMRIKILAKLEPVPLKTYIDADFKHFTDLDLDHDFWFVKYKQIMQNKEQEDDDVSEYDNDYIHAIKRMHLCKSNLKNGIFHKYDIATKQKDITKIIAKISDNELYIYAASDDKTVNIYRRSVKIDTLKGHEGGVWALDARFDMIVTGSTDKTLKVWRPKDRSKELCSPYHLNHLRPLSHSCDALTVHSKRSRRTQINHADLCINGRQSAVSSLNQHYSVSAEGHASTTNRYNLTGTYACTNTLFGHSSTVRCALITEYGIVSGGRDGDIRIWECDGTLKHVLKGHSLSVRSIACKGIYLVSGSYDGTVVLWNLLTGNKICNFITHASKVYKVVIDKHIISSEMNGVIYVSDYAGKVVRILNEHRNIVPYLIIDRNYLYSGGADGLVLKWDLETGDIVWRIVERHYIMNVQLIDDFVLVATNHQANLYTKEGVWVRRLLKNCQVVHDCATADGCIAIGYRDRSKNVIAVYDFNDRG